MLGEILGSIGSAIGGLFGQSSANKMAQEQLDWQKKLAYQQVQMRVQDATKAGIHPLAALGMSPVSFSPVSVGDPASSMASAGQNIGRAIAAAGTKDDQTQQLSLELARTQIQGAQIDNEIKRQELASRVRRSLGPMAVGTPSAGLPAVQPNTARGGDIGGQALPLPFGLHLTTGRTATAEEIERQYGDILQNVYGFARGAEDLINQVNRDYPGDWSKYTPSGVLNELFGISPAY